MEDQKIHFSELSHTRTIIFQNYSCIKELTAFPIELYGYDLATIKTYFFVPLVVAIIGVFSMYTYFAIINLRVINVRSKSPQLRRLHRNYIVQIICQTLLPLFVLFFPMMCLAVLLYQEIWGHVCKYSLL